MKTKLTSLLGIEYPVLQGAMAWVSEARMAAAVSAAGGAGIIATGGQSGAWVREQIRLAKSLTAKPFGVNVTLLSPTKDEVIEVICEEKVAFVTIGAGNSVPYFPVFDKAGIKKIPIVPNARLAQRVEASGADAIVIEGMEAGGHIGVLTTMALMTQVIPLVSIPVVAAGGFADGRGMAAALVMGAAGIQIGTRFMVAEECPVHPKFKEKLIAAVDTDTVVTGATIGHGVRGLKNKFTEKFLALERSGTPEEELNRLAAGTNRLAAVDGDIENGMVQAGQSLLPLKRVEPVKAILEAIVAEAGRVLAGAPGLVKQ